MATPIRMMETAFARVSVGHGRVQSRKCQGRVETLRQRITDNFAAAGIQNGREEAEAGRHPDVGEVGDPYPVWLVGDGIAVEVWKDRGVVLAVGCSHKAPPGLDAKSGKHNCERRV